MTEKEIPKTGIDLNFTKIEDEDEVEATNVREEAREEDTLMAAI